MIEVPAITALLWYPIETAPKDGTRILLAWPNGDIAIGAWMDIAVEPDPNDPDDTWGRIVGWSDDGRGINWIDPHPSHWMPLPGSPFRRVAS